MQRLSTYKLSLLVLLAASQSLSFIDRVNLSVVLPELIKEHAYSASLAGILMSVLNFSYIAALLAAGPLTDRYRARRAFPLAVSFWSVTTALCGFTVQFLPLAVLRAMVGIGESPCIPSGAQVIQQNFSKTERGLAVSVQFSGNKIGLAVGIPLSAFLLSHFGRPWVFYATGFLGAVWVLAWVLIYREPRTAESGLTEPRATKIAWSSLLKERSMWGMMLGQAGYLYVYYVFATWLPGYLLLRHNLGTMNAGVLAMLPFVSAVGFTLIGGWLADSLVARGRKVSVVRKSLAVSGLVGATMFIIVAAFSEQTWMAVMALTCAVSALSITTSSANAMPIDVAPPELVSSCSALQNIGGNIGGALAPLITGFLVSGTGDFVVPLLFTAAVGLIFGAGGYGLVVQTLEKRIGESAAPLAHAAYRVAS